MFADASGSFPDLKEKIQSLAVEISLEEDIEKSVVNISLLNLNNLKEIIFAVGHEERLLEFKYAEYIRFSKPEAMASSLWRRWKGGIEHMHLFKGCVVRVVKAKIL